MWATDQERESLLFRRPQLVTLHSTARRRCLLPDTLLLALYLKVVLPPAHFTALLDLAYKSKIRSVLHYAGRDHSAKLPSQRRGYLGCSSFTMSQGCYS
jgi:hypothetical protein